MTLKLKPRSLLKDALLILIGSLCYSGAVGLFLEPNDLTSGGLTGISIIINHFTSLPVGTMTFIFNIPLFIIGVIKFGFKFLCSTIISVFMVSGFIDLFSMVPQPTDDKLLACMAGGVLMAIGIGLIFKAGATTGGSDIVVKLLRLKFKAVKTGELFLCTDFVIATLTAILFQNFNIVLYAAITLGLQMVVLDLVLYGTDEAKLVYIISDKYEAIADIILKEKEFGITYLKGVGAYTKTDKQVIMCVVKKQNLAALREIVTMKDDQAFMIITSASAVFGEGFKSHDSEEL